jgi:fucose 4-O-acetylase-like acetyltransferase
MYNAKKYYLGIEILRAFFSFFILLFHLMNKKIYSHIFKKIVHQIMGLALKSFFIISFYFSYNSFSFKKINKIKKRFKRLIIPYVIWPIIIYLQKTLFSYMHGKKKGVLFKFLIYQILIGNGIYLYFWFSFNLIFISLLFIIIIFVTQKYMALLILFGFLVFFISISNIYNQFWKGYNRIVAFPIRPISENYIQGLIGFFFSSIKIFEKKFTKKYSLLCIFTLLLLIILNKSIFRKFIESLLSGFLILIFTSIPFEELNNSIYNLIKQMTGYTGGIYYIHVYLNKLLKKYVSFKYNPGTIFTCIIHYFLCYFICFIGSKIFKNNILKYLFF